MAKSSTERSLLLIDEFGKGTNNTDGIALLASTLRYFDSQPFEQMPKVLVATHFYEIVQLPRIASQFKNVCPVVMDYLVTY